MTDSTATSAYPSRTPSEQLFMLTGAFMHYRALQTAAELGLADHLANSPLEVDDLATRSKAHAPSLFRMMRTLESVGVFKQVSPRVFANTPVSELLRTGVPGSQWAYVRAVSPGGGIYEAWSGFTYSVRTGKPAFEQIHGCSIWEFMRQHPVQAAVFDEFMRNAQAAMTPAATAAYDWSRFPVIADIGGGIGGQLVDILNAHPSCKGILLDRPDVIARALLHERIERVAGNFFERVPAGADAYVLRAVIHDWGDEDAVRILKTVRQAAKPDSRVILIEFTLPETSEYAYGKTADLTMLALTGGQERTANEYRELLDKAGFEVEQIIPTPAQTSLVVSQPRP
jgi:O-methyltransferase domain/Dimerisation domain